MLSIWLAKVVASKRYDRSTAAKLTLTHNVPSGTRDVHTRDHDKWRTLDGIPQTGELLDKEIVQRVGDVFYESLFVPSIRVALDAGDTYISRGAHPGISCHCSPIK
jgi:hypothetical protein